MKIDNFKTKYNLEDIVYLIYKNKIERAVVTGIRVTFEEELKSSGYKILDIVKYAKKFFNDHKKNYSVLYTIDISDSEGKFYCCPGGYFSDEDLYYTKEELINSATYNRR